MKKAEQQYEKTVLGNGLRVVSCFSPKFSNSALAITLLGGSREEDCSEIGLTHLLEHLLFKRTSSLQTIDILESIDLLGGDVNASTDTDELNLYGEVPAEKFGEMFGLFSSLLLESQFNQSDVSIEKNIVKQEILDSKDDAESFAFQRFSEIFWPNSSFGLPVFGYLESVAALQLDRLQERLKDLLCGERIVITAAGNISHAQVVDKAQELFSELPRGQGAEHKTPEYGQAMESIGCQSEQVSVCIGLPYPSLRHPDYMTARMSSLSLGGLMSSRLFRKLREEQGLAYDIGSSVEAFADTAALLVQGSFEAESFESSFSKLIEELKSVFRGGISEKEFSTVRSSYLVGLESERDDLGSLLWRLQSGEVVHGRFLNLEAQIDRVQSLRFDDMNSFSENWHKKPGESGEGVTIVLGSNKPLELKEVLASVWK